MPSRADHPLLQRLRAAPILADGAMGTLLNRHGISYDRCLDELNLSEPALVQRIHRDYLAAGATLIETNTFGGNRVRLAPHGLEGRIRDINLHGVRLAREAIQIESADAFVAGSIGPLGVSLTPSGPITPAAAREMFSEQAAALIEGGVDLLIIETMSDPEEMAAAVGAVRSIASDIPIVAAMTFDERALTPAGKTPEEIGRFLDGLPVDVLGANCSVGPRMMLDVIGRMSQVTTRPLVAMPNAGLPRLIDGRYEYPATPEDLAACVEPFLAAGVRIIGGCCGTTPEHIAAMRRALDALRRG